MPPFIISFLMKNVLLKFVPKLILLFVLMVTGVSASIWYLDGWSAAFTSLGVVMLSILAVPVVIILGIVSMLQIGKEFKEFIFRKRSKSDFIMSVMQGAGQYMMSKELGSMFGEPEKKEKKSFFSKKTKDENISEVREDKNNINETALSGLSIGTAGVVGGTELVNSLMASNDENTYKVADGSGNEEIDMLAMMNNPEVQAQMQQMMQMMMNMGVGEEDDGEQVDLTMLMGAMSQMNFGEINEQIQLPDPNKDIEDVEVKKPS